MHSSQLSEFFWELVENICDTRNYLLTFRSGLPQRRAPLYAESVQALGPSLDGSWAFWTLPRSKFLDQVNMGRCKGAFTPAIRALI